MAAAKPWMKFYPRDWRADEKLRDCSLAARGLWIEMLAIMHASERYGRLLIAGKTPSTASLARQVGADVAEVEALLSELEGADVFSRDSQGIIYSRRMKSDEKIAENARKNGKRGGNPNLCKDTENSDADKGQDKEGDKAGLKLRGQRPEKKPSVSTRATTIPDDWKPEPFGPDTEAASIVADWSPEYRASQAERFAGHHRAKGSKFVDWQAAWGTWVRNSPAMSRFREPQGSTDADPYNVRGMVEQINRRSATGGR